MKNFNLGMLVSISFMLVAGLVYSLDAFMVYGTIFAAMAGWVLTLEMKKSILWIISGFLPITIQTGYGLLAKFGIHTGIIPVALLHIFVAMFFLNFLIKTLLLTANNHSKVKIPE